VSGDGADLENALGFLRVLLEPQPDIGPSGELIDMPEVKNWIRRQRAARRAARRLLAKFREPTGPTA